MPAGLWPAAAAAMFGESLPHSRSVCLMPVCSRIHTPTDMLMQSGPQIPCSLLPFSPANLPRHHHCCGACQPAQTADCRNEEAHSLTAKQSMGRLAWKFSKACWVYFCHAKAHARRRHKHPVTWARLRCTRSHQKLTNTACTSAAVMRGWGLGRIMRAEEHHSPQTVY